MNWDEGFYQFPHIYDYSPSTTVNLSMANCKAVSEISTYDIV